MDDQADANQGSSPGRLSAFCARRHTIFAYDRRVERAGQLSSLFAASQNQRALLIPGWAW